jgi:hypothetical protein
MQLNVHFLYDKSVQDSMKSVIAALLELLKILFYEAESYALS